MGIDDDARAGAGQRKRFDTALRRCADMRNAHLLLERRLGGKQHRGAARLGLRALQFDDRALQVVVAARRDRRLLVARRGGKPGVNVMHDAISGAGRNNAQMLQRCALLEARCFRL